MECQNFLLYLLKENNISQFCKSLKEIIFGVATGIKERKLENTFFVYLYRIF